ncbi:hypothetical protein P9112_009226 [Eukaryota sp. TZLM1-RC]
MSESHRINSYLEPLLSRLVDEITVNSFNRNKGDLMLEDLEGTTNITVVRSTDVCNNSFMPLAQSKHKNPLSVAEKAKIDKSKAKLVSLNAESHTHYVLFLYKGQRRSFAFPYMARLDYLLYLSWMILLKL